MRTARSLAFVLLVLFSATSVFAQKGEYAVAKDAQLDKYPVLEANKPLTVMQIADMHLHPVRLEKPTVVQNHFRGLHGKEGRFVVETLPKGTLVLVDENNNLRYKEDCGNRLVEFDNQALVRGIVSSIKLPEATVAPARATPAQVKARSQESGLWRAVRSLWGHTMDFLRPIANWLGWFLGWGVIWILIFAILAALYESARGWGQEPGYPPVPVAPQPARQVVQVVRSQPAVNTAIQTPPPPTQAQTVAAGETANSGSSRAFITHSAGSGSTPHLVRWGGLDFHSLEVAPDGVHSLRYHPRPVAK